jgi:hypothetical protein
MFRRCPPGGGWAEEQRNIYHDELMYFLEGILVMHINPQTNIVNLDKSLDPLKDQFNSYKDKIRFIALLSPTCPL